MELTGSPTTVSPIFTGSKYSFNFSGLEGLIRLALECGIEYFEHPHPFTQWGAEHAPAIYARIDGEKITCFTIPKSAESMRGFRELINREIEKRL